MLRKLMKYDLKYYRKIMLPLWAVLIIYGIVHGINTVFNYETFYDHIPIKAQAIVVVTGIYFIFCVNIILVIQRFWKSMYGKESYLTHTLPVTERKLILSKVFSAIIISFTTVFIFFAENDITVFSHDFNDQTFLADISKLIQMLNLNFDNTLKIRLCDRNDPSTTNMFTKQHAEVWSLHRIGFSFFR